MKQVISRSKYIFRVITSPLRLLPDFIIIGTQKGGTTYLYQKLLSHPNIVPAAEKEIHYFDLHFHRGANWYRSRFPSWPYKWYTQIVQQVDWLVGESSPYYLFHPHVPQRVARLLPQVKLIAVLRNPIDRAYSHYHHQVRIKQETNSFEEAIALEHERLESEAEKLQQDDTYYSFNHHHFSYLARGLYLDQLMTWWRFFSQSQLLILPSERLFSHPHQVMAKILDFLELPFKEFPYTEPVNQGHYGEMASETRNRLRTYFRLHNQRLYDFLNVDFGWD